MNLIAMAADFDSLIKNRYRVVLGNEGNDERNPKGREMPLVMK